MVKQLRVLIDTNVAYTYVSGRDDSFVFAIMKIMELCSRKEIEGFLAIHSVSVIWYLTRKIREEKRREMLLELCELLTITGTSHTEVVSAIQKEQFRDFEDCLQDKCAKSAQCDYLVTANVKDYIFSEIPAVTPNQFLSIWTELLESS